MNDTLNRRRFVATVAATGAVACACALVGAGEGEALGVDPAPAPGPVDSGAIAQYAKDGVYDPFAKSHKFFLVRGGGRLIALSALCTHKSCTLKLKESVITCPCHGSRFGADGATNKGPAKAPLWRYGIALNDADHVVVDTSKRFNEGQCDEAESYVRV